jgi:hypothetical protein
MMLCNTPVITDHPDSQTVCEGASVQFCVTATGASSYQWKKNGSNVPGATSSCYTINPVTTAAAGNYSCVVSNSCGSVESNLATLTVNTAPIITQHPQNVTVFEGQDAVFTVEATGTSPLHYQWKKNGANVGTDSSILTLYSVQLSDDGSQITCDVNNVCGVITSNIAILAVNPQSGPVLLMYDDFESGWGSYMDGGRDCRLYTGGTYAHQGQQAANIQDDSGQASSFYSTAGIDTATPGYNQIEVDFWFYAVGMESGENFAVEYYDGVIWQTVARYVAGTDFVNGSFNHVTVHIDKSQYAFPTNMNIRFVCNASANSDDVYIDEIKVSAEVDTPDTTPPDPNPMTWATAPYATGSTSIAMVATTASDTSGVEYYFACTFGGGSDSGWQNSTMYEDTGLNPNTLYTYQVKARDKSANRNETIYSTAESATTDPGCTASTTHVESIVCETLRGSKGNKYGLATVTVYNNCGEPVSGAEVTGTFTGDYNEQLTGITNSNGVAIITTSTQTKKPLYEFCVDNVTHETLTYNPSNNIETCKSN